MTEKMSLVDQVRLGSFNKDFLTEVLVQLHYQGSKRHESYVHMRANPDAHKSWKVCENDIEKARQMLEAYIFSLTAPTKAKGAER